MIDIRDKRNEADWHSIRETVFMKEQGFQNEFDKIDRIAIHVVLYIDGKGVGCGRIYPDQEQDTVWHLGRLAILKEYRACGYGKHIICALEEKAKEKGAVKVILSAQQHAIGFYQKNGYRPIGGLYMDEHVPHQSMEKVL